MLAKCINNGFKPSYHEVSVVEPGKSAQGRTQRTCGIFPPRTPGDFRWPLGGSLYVRDAALMAENAQKIMMAERAQEDEEGMSDR